LLNTENDLEKLIDEIREGESTGLNETRLEMLRQFGFDDQPPAPKEGAGFLVDKVFQPILQFFNRRKSHPRELSPKEIVRLAGEPLDPEDRLNCPHCDAVIHKSSQKCEWCGKLI
jgi:hypothetical protein